jgi:hypothetical protein
MREKKWVTFMYWRNYKCVATGLLKNTDINIAFKTTNTIGNVLKLNTKIPYLQNDMPK